MIDSEHATAIVKSAVNRYRWATRRIGGLDVEDLMQVGRLAVAKAERSWKPERGVPFAGFAARAVRNDVHRAANEQTSVVRLPFTQLETGAKRAAIIEGDRPLRVDGADASETLWDVIDSPTVDTTDPMVRRRVRTCLERIPERWADVLKMRYFLDLEYADIGAALGTSRSRAQQLEAKGLAAFRAEWLADCVEEEA